MVQSSFHSWNTPANKARWIVFNSEKLTEKRRRAFSNRVDNLLSPCYFVKDKVELWWEHEDREDYVENDPCAGCPISCRKCRVDRDSQEVKNAEKKINVFLKRPSNVETTVAPFHLAELMIVAWFTILLDVCDSHIHMTIRDKKESRRLEEITEHIIESFGFIVWMKHWYSVSNVHQSESWEDIVMDIQFACIQ